MFSKPIFCSKIAQKGKTIAQKVPIEHNRDRPSRESVKFLFVRAQKKGDALEVRVIIGKYRTIQKYSRDRRHKEEKKATSSWVILPPCFLRKGSLKGRIDSWMNGHIRARLRLLTAHSNKSMIYCCRGIWEINRCPLDGLKIKAWRQILVQRLNLFLFGWKPRLFSRRFH